jgi:hypothetical protein
VIDTAADTRPCGVSSISVILPSPFPALQLVCVLGWGFGAGNRRQHLFWREMTAYGTPEVATAAA